MKKAEIKVDIINNTITITKAFRKKASVYGTDEYVALRKVIMENPTYSIIITSPKKKSYKDLTFQRMEAYIKTQPNSEARLIEFKAVKKVAEAKGSKYPLTKHWFLETYSDYKLNEVSADETETIIKGSQNITNINEAKTA